MNVTPEPALLNSCTDPYTRKPGVTRPTRRRLTRRSWVSSVCVCQQSAERCVSTLLDLIQTKVNYVVQEAIVVIKDIFRKYPNK